MKDMYIDYNRNRRDEHRGRRIAAVVVLVILAVGIGVGGYFFTKYYLGVTDEQLAPKTDPISAAADGMAAGEENTETGIYGLWTMDNTDTQAPTSIYDDLDDEKWMADFVDTRKRVEVKGIYLSAQSFNKKLNDAIRYVEETELNAIVVDIKSDYGTISYQMDCELAKEIGANTRTIADIDEFVADMKSRGIYLIARIVTMKDPVLGKARPDLAVHFEDGTIYKDKDGYTWLNPYLDEVWDYTIEICRHCAEAGFDEVNLDYIRFATERGAMDADYSPEGDGITRTEAITKGVKRICEEIKPLGVFVSCDVFGSIISSSLDASYVGQSYYQMSQYLDYICPMVYPSHYSDGYYNLDYPDCHPYELICGAMADSKKILYMIDDTVNKADVRPWLQDFTASWVKHHLTYGKEEVRAQIDAVYDSGYSQWLLWNAAINYTQDALLPAED